MFENIKNWVLRGIDRMFAKSTIEDALKIKTAVSNVMDKAMKLWLEIYTNNAAWISKEVPSLNLGASISEEFARLTTLEMKSEITGSSRADYLTERYKKVLENLKNNLTLFNAVGGGFLKPYVKGGQIYIDYVPQTDCKPLAYDNAGNITSIVFTSQIIKGDKVYTRLETHTHKNNIYVIENKVYVADINSSSGLGRIASLKDVQEWSELGEKGIISNVNRPLFAYYKVPIANNVDPKSCLGASVYSKAIENIRKADIQASRIDYEYDSAERSIYADVSALKNENGIIKKQKIVKTLDTGEDGFYKEFSPNLRDEGFIRGLDKIKREIEFQCSLAYGTLSEMTEGEKTATEINASKQRSYSTVAQMQISLQYALEHLIYILDVYTTLYKLAPNGVYEVSFEWDDSIIVDTETEQRIRLQETNLGLGSKLDYLMWRYGLTEEQAQEKLDRIKQEKSETNLFNEE